MRRLMPEFKLTSYEELTGYKDEPSSPDMHDLKSSEGVVNLPLSELHTFKNHPYKVRDDKKMNETIESIRKYGILNPIMVRTRPEGGYEIISGHRRRHAALSIGLTEVPAIIHECSDEEAAIAMVDLNIQRDGISHSEKAKAYRIKYEALKHQGKKSEKNALDEMAEAAGENVKKIQRYLCLSRLSDELLELMDSKKLGFSQGVDISFLNVQEQKWVYQVIQKYKVSLTTFKASKLKECSKSGTLDEASVEGIILATVQKTEAVTISKETVERLFGNTQSKESIEQLAVYLLENWLAEHNDEKERRHKLLDILSRSKK